MAARSHPTLESAWVRNLGADLAAGGTAKFEPLAHNLPCFFADAGLAGRSRRLRPRTEIDRRPDRRKADLVVGAHIAEEGRSGADADPRLQ
jgi:hypothetical protein